MNKKLIEELVDLNNQQKVIEAKITALKVEIEKELPAAGYKDESVTISRKAGSTTTSIDLKSFEEKEPELYKDLVRDYSKTSTKKGSISYTFAKKKEK